MLLNFDFRFLLGASEFVPPEFGFAGDAEEPQEAGRRPSRPGEFRHERPRVCDCGGSAHACSAARHSGPSLARTSILNLTRGNDTGPHAAQVSLRPPRPASLLLPPSRELQCRAGGAVVDVRA
jgi:hypothetical protein